MREYILKCDRCKKQTDCLYEVSIQPNILKFEVCESCAALICNLIQRENIREKF